MLQRGLWAVTPEEYLAIPYVLVVESVEGPDGQWYRRATYPELGVSGEALSPLDAIARLEEALGRRIRVLRLPTAAFELAGRAAERVAKARGSAPIFDERRARDLTVHTWTCDPSGTERELGWRAEVSLAEGLNLAARWYRKAGWL